MKKIQIFKFSIIKKLRCEIFLPMSRETFAWFLEENIFALHFPLFEMDFRDSGSLQSHSTETGGPEVENDTLKVTLTTVYSDK